MFFTPYNAGSAEPTDWGKLVQIAVENSESGSEYSEESEQSDSES